MPKGEDQLRLRRPFAPNAEIAEFLKTPFPAVPDTCTRSVLENPFLEVIPGRKRQEVRRA
jgi:hypothetical protein